MSKLITVAAASALLACGQPEVDDNTLQWVAYADDQAHPFELDLTTSENAIDSVRAIVLFGVHDMTAAGDTYSVDVPLANCQAHTPYYFQVRYDSPLPTQPDGLLTVNEPRAGAYIVRRTGGTLQQCRSIEGLSFTVTSTSDLADANPGDGLCAAANGGCSLRAAIMEANARPGHDRITLGAGPYVLTLTGREALDTPDDAVGDLDITDGVSIEGPTTSDGAVIDADFNSRVFQIVTSTLEYVNLTALTLQGGRVIGEPGGAIYNDANTKLDRVRMIDNRLDADGEESCGASVNLEVCNRGGAIFNKFRLYVLSSTVQRNYTCSGGGICDTGQGGGISNFGSGARLFVHRSTIADNSARFIGGIHNVGGFVEIVNSSFSNNTPLHWVSSLYTTGGGRLSLAHVTISESASLPVILNSSVIDDEYSDVVIESSVVHIDHDDGTLCTGPLVSNQNNFVGGSDEAQDYIGSCNLTGFTPVTGRLSVGGLFDHGGPTETIEVLDIEGNIPVIDNSSLVCPNVDQRGEPRDGDADGAAKIGCDPGALEHDD